MLIVLAYGNTFDASWHLDDATIIVHNPNVHVSSLSVEEWSASMHQPFSNPENVNVNFYRPVAMLSLAMNWFLGGTEVYGYHLVNLGIHCLNTILLFYTCLLLLMAPNMRSRYQGREPGIALLAAALWALHPIQIQAVTYIVQRMASLAALFYLFGILTYIKGRTAENRRKRLAMFALCLLSFVLAMGSKENAVTLPVALLLIEVIFYRDIEFLQRARGRWLTAGSLAALIIVAGLVLCFWPGNPLSGLFDSYEARPFTCYERALTQFRVLMLYLFQIFYPITQQFSIVHALKVSTSPVAPWTTFPAMLGVGLLLGAAIAGMRRFRLFAFAVLFFFLGHSIESSIFPLELVFEHRNYLPTLFLFLPLASGLVALLDYYYQRNTVLFGILAAFMSLLVTGLAFATYTRNMDWATEKTLWQDAVTKAPTMARPYQALALAYENAGKLDQAYVLYHKALSLDDPDPQNSRFNSLGNMGNILKKQKDYVGAIQLLNKAMEYKKGPYTNRVRYNLALCLLNVGQEKVALEHIDALLDKQPRNYRYLSIKGFLLLVENDIEGALLYLRTALNQNPYDMHTLLNLGMAMSAAGAYEHSAWFLKRAGEQSPGNLVIHLSKLQNALQMQDDERIRLHLLQIASLFSIEDIQRTLNEQAQGHLYIEETLVALDGCKIQPLLVDYFRNKADQWVLDSGVNNS